MQRIAQITTRLQLSLESSFGEGLRSGDVNTLRQCLRTYATIDKTRDAENLFRQLSVKPYMQEVVTEHVLADVGLSAMYAKVVDFVPNHCDILRSVLSGQHSNSDVIRGYDFVVNSVWPEFVANLEARTPSIFAPGNPNHFHEVDFFNSHHACSFLASSFQPFLTRLDALALFVAALHNKYDIPQQLRANVRLNSERSKAARAPQLQHVPLQVESSRLLPDSLPRNRRFA